MSKRSDIHRIANELRKRFPPAFKVKVRIKPMKAYWEWCNIFGTDEAWEHFLLVIDANAEFRWQRDALIHGWAHMLAWSHLHDANPDWHGHDEAWGVWYAKVYQFVMYDREAAKLKDGP